MPPQTFKGLRKEWSWNQEGGSVQTKWVCGQPAGLGAGASDRLVDRLCLSGITGS